MRIAFAPAARLLSDTRPNGEALIAMTLLRRLAARGHRIVAYCERAELTREIDGVDVREISAKGPTAALSRINFARRIAADAARERFEIVHGLFPITTDAGFVMADCAPVVVGPLNLPWPADAAPTRRLRARAAGLVLDAVERRLHARTLERAQRILVTGPTSREAMPGRYRDRCVDVPFGIDLARFDETPLPNSPVILFLSNLQPRKGAEVAVRAMRSVLAEIPDARLVIAGADVAGERDRLEALATDLGVARAVGFVGPVAPDEAQDWYRRARVLCQPSRGEPFGMTVLEAMACGRPVVATDAGGMPDLVVDGIGGWLEPPGDAGAIGRALVRVLTQPGQAEAMGAFNRARAAQRFGIERVAERIERTYAALVPDRREVSAVAA